MRRNWHPRSEIAGLFCIQLRTLNTPSHRNNLRLAKELCVKITHPRRGDATINRNAPTTERSSGKEYADRKMCCISKWWSWTTSKTLGWDNPNYRAISREIFCGSCATAAIMISLLARVCTACGRPTFVKCSRYYFLDSWRQCSNHWNVLVSSRMTRCVFPCTNTSSLYTFLICEQEITLSKLCVRI